VFKLVIQKLITKNGL